MKRMNISRRTMLRGTERLALPWLEVMRANSILASETAAERPIRVAAMFFPNGVREDRWTPEGTGTDWEPTSQLQPLGDMKRDVSVLSGLWHEATDTGDGHYVKDAAWLTGTTITKTTGVNLNSGGVSMDEIAARTFGHSLPCHRWSWGSNRCNRVLMASSQLYACLWSPHRLAYADATIGRRNQSSSGIRSYDSHCRSSTTSRSDRPLLDLVGENADRVGNAIGCPRSPSHRSIPSIPFARSNSGSSTGGLPRRRLGNDTLTFPAAKLPWMTQKSMRIACV